MDIPGGSLTLVGIFLMGLGLNLTPCVYPMISVTVSVFGGTRHHHFEAFLHALVYVLGICFTYSLLGAVAALTGGLFGALLQNRWVLLTVSFMLLALALSMFGVFTFQAPAFVLNKVKAVHARGLLKYFVSGLFVGIFAAPCIGPPILALLTFVGTRGDPWFAFWTFFVLSLGLGMPYLILGTFSSLLHRLPKSGVWLVWVERLFGFLLLVLAAFYMILALNAVWLKWLLPAALVAGGVYLGFLERDGDQYPFFRRIKRIAGVLAVIAGLALPLTGSNQVILWETYAPAKLDRAKDSQQPVILDFYADWCVSCHELDQFTYSDARVIKAMEGFTRLKVDLTDPDTADAGKAMKRFSILGVPTIVFFDQDGKEIEEARVAGFIPPEEMLKILKSPRLRKLEEPARNRPYIKENQE
jgi:thioredoxin:protein disulfide reductase